MLPKFCVVSSIGDGDLDILFDDRISNELCEWIDCEVNKIIPNLSIKNRTPEHLESIVKGIFSNMAICGRLKKDLTNNSWEVRKYV